MTCTSRGLLVNILHFSLPSQHVSQTYPKAIMMDDFRLLTPPVKILYLCPPSRIVMKTYAKAINIDDFSLPDAARPRFPVSGCPHELSKRHETRMKIKWITRASSNVMRGLACHTLFHLPRVPLNLPRVLRLGAASTYLWISQTSACATPRTLALHTRFPALNQRRLRTYTLACARQKTSALHTPLPVLDQRRLHSTHARFC